MLACMQTKEGERVSDRESGAWDTNLSSSKQGMTSSRMLTTARMQALSKSPPVGEGSFRQMVHMTRKLRRCCCNLTSHQGSHLRTKLSSDAEYMRCMHTSKIHGYLHSHNMRKCHSMRRTADLIFFAVRCPLPMREGGVSHKMTYGVICTCSQQGVLQDG